MGSRPAADSPLRRVRPLRVVPRLGGLRVALRLTALRRPPPCGGWRPAVAGRPAGPTGLGLLMPGPPRRRRTGSCASGSRVGRSARPALRRRIGIGGAAAHVAGAPSSPATGESKPGHDRLDAAAGAATRAPWLGRLGLDPDGGAAGVAERGVLEQRHLALGAELQLALGADPALAGRALQRGLHQPDVQHVADPQDQDAQDDQAPDDAQHHPRVASPTKENR